MFSSQIDPAPGTGLRHVRTASEHTPAQKQLLCFRVFTEMGSGAFTARFEPAGIPWHELPPRSRIRLAWSFRTTAFRSSDKYQ
jgi:hypothetical protein